MADKISKPKHYARYKIEPVVFIMENNIPYCEANAIKYLCRWRYKHKAWGEKLEDLLKAREYIERRILQVKNLMDADDTSSLDLPE